VAAFAGEGQKVLVIAVLAFHEGKAVAQVATVQVPAYDMLKMGAEESIGPLINVYSCTRSPYAILPAHAACLLLQKRPGHAHGH
jgi:hypothetical protein